MRVLHVVIAATVGLLGGMSAAAAPDEGSFPPPPDHELRVKAAAILGEAVKQHADDPRKLSHAAEKAADLLGEDSHQAARLRAAAEETSDATALADALQAIRSDIAFEPVFESPLPINFPTYTPVGELRLQQFPTYRLARAKVTGGTTVPFMKLFRHIQSRDIPMTVPVQMETRGDDGVTRRTSMGFLYRTPDQGPTGEAEDDVEVVDAPPSKALSIGYRGYESRKAIRSARARFDRWLAENEQYVADGELRIMGWNGPAVAGSRRYYEVQLPVRPAKTGSDKSAKQS